MEYDDFTPIYDLLVAELAVEEALKNLLEQDLEEE